MPEPRSWFTLPAAAAALYLALALHAAHVETPTADEFAHVPAGVAAWREGRTDLYRSNPPLFKLLLAAPVALDSSVVAPPAYEPPMAWGPWDYAHRFMNANRDRYLALMARARVAAVLCGLAAGALVFAWARELAGLRAAAVTASVFLLDPNVLAHGHLATIDMAALATVLLAAYVLRRALRRPGWLRILSAGAALGLALAVKFVALLLLPAFAVLVLARRLRAEGSLGRRVARAGAELLALGAAALLVVNASVAFQGSFAPLGALPFRSDFALGLQSGLPGRLPVPLPREYVLGFDAAKKMQERGEFGSYLLGRWSEHGFWYYNLVALGVKLPLATLVLLALAAPAWRRARLGAGELLAIAVPAATLLAVFASASNLNIGLRHVLPVLPFLYLLIAPLFRATGDRRRARASAALAAAVLAIALRTAIALHPDTLTFFNAIAGGPARGGDWLLDSNLDWGQDLYRVPEAVAAIDPDAPLYLLYWGHVDPALYGLRYQLLPSHPVEGVVAVSENFLRGHAYLTVAPDGSMIGVTGDNAAWLRGREPVARLGSIRVYDTRARRP
ncbi:MAG TPA: phospholipid carrier-dependent glycosyltransferase [Myxococcota bacterium]|nr:phospholipid carrier-dependent glycosyltransferase [Myxococcota bacterium]